jgi:hypothetical protein
MQISSLNYQVIAMANKLMPNLEGSCQKERITNLKLKGNLNDNQLTSESHIPTL